MPDKKDFQQVEELHQEERKDLIKVQFNLSETEQRKVVDTILWKADTYEESRTGYMTRVIEARRLYEGNTGHIKSPYPDLPVISTMVTTWVVDLLLAKLFPLVWNESLIYWKGRETSDIENADNVGKFMRWAIVEELKLSGVIQQLLQDMLIDGTFAVKISWEVLYKWMQRITATGLRERVREGILRVLKRYETKYEYKRLEKPLIERLAIEDVLFPYDAKDSDNYDVIQRVYYDYNILEDFGDRGYLINVDKSLIVDIDEKTLKQQSSEKAKQEEEGTTEHDRYKREENPAECFEAYLKYPINGRLMECVFFIHKTSKRYLSGKALVDISRIEQRPIIVCPLKERSGRLLGKSMAMDVAPLHKEMDAIHNQRIHAGLIAIAPPGFYRPASGLKPKKMQYGPGWLLPLDDPQRDIYFPPFSGELLRISFQEETMVLGLIERLSSVSAYMLGKESEVVKSRATATGTLALIGQAEQRFTTLAKSVQDGIGQILVRILRQYQQKMPPGLAERVLGADGKNLFPENITPEDIAGEYDCYLELDFAASNRTLEKQTAVLMYQQLSVEPLVNRDPALRWEVVAEYVRAMGRGKQIELYIGNKPPSLEAYNADAEVEFTQMNQGKRVEPKPNESAMAHIVAHIAQRSSERFTVMPLEYRPLLDEHIFKTQQLVIMQLQQQAEAAELAQRESMTPGGGQTALPITEGGGGGGQQTPGVNQGLIGAPGMATPAGTQTGIGQGMAG